MNNTLNEKIKQECKTNTQDQSFAVIEFKGHRYLPFVNKNKLKLNKGDKVLVQLDSGIDIGSVVFTKNSNCISICNRDTSEISNFIIKIADNNDLDKEYINRYDEPDVVLKTNEMALDFEINMKIVDAEWQFDKQKLTIYFTAPDRVDFRELVKEFARQFKTRIELRQINSREETRRLGCGIGCCGQTMCCTSFLFDFNQVTIEHAKIQRLSNNVTKLSGNCGRLKCCLLFEYEHYEAELKKYPVLNSIIQLEDGEGILNKIDIFKKSINIYNLTQKKNLVISLGEIEKYVSEGKVMPPNPVDYKENKIFEEDIILSEEDY